MQREVSKSEGMYRYPLDLPIEPDINVNHASEGPLSSARGRSGNKRLRRQPPIGIGREQKVPGFSAHCLSETQDVTAAVDGGRLRRTIAVGCQVESSRIRAPSKKMSSVVTSRLVRSDDARSGIYSDRMAGQTHDHRSDSVLEHCCHRLTI